MAKAVRQRLSRQESRVQTRERLLDSARQLFSKNGIEATSIESVAESAGYSRGAFYSNFETKDDLVVAVLERELAINREKLEAIFAGEMTARGLKAVRDYYVEFATDRNGCMFLAAMQMYALQHPGVRQRISVPFRNQRAQIVKLVQRAAGDLKKQKTPFLAKPEALVISLTSLSMGLCLSWMMDRESIDISEVQQSLELSFDYLARVKTMQAKGQ